MNEFSSVLQNFLDRLKNRFFGPFALTWLIYNWRFLVILMFGESDTSSDRISDAEQQLGILSFVIPLTVTVAYIYGSPWLSLGVETRPKPSDKT